MKKLLAILMSLVFVFCFSTLAFATGEEVEKADEETVSGDEFVYTDGAYEFSDEEEQMLENIYGEDFVDSLENGEFDLNQMLESTGLEKSTLLLAMIFTTTSLLFIPTLIVLIIFRQALFCNPRGGCALPQRRSLKSSLRFQSHRRRLYRQFLSRCEEAYPLPL